MAVLAVAQGRGRRKRHDLDIVDRYHVGGGGTDHHIGGPHRLSL